MVDRTKQKSGNILIVDDNEDVLRAAKIYLKRHFGSVDVEKKPEHLPNLLDNKRYDVILLDMNFTQDVSSGNEGFFWLDKILEMDPSAVVVLITAYGGVEMAVKAIKEGATDFVLKPWDNEKLLATILSAMKLRTSRDEVEQLKSRQQQMNEDLDARFKDIIGKSDAMLKVYETVHRIADTDASVLILGENGTGKELIARAIHRNSNRAGKNFVNVDLGAISETLFESELFGHVKGAFTDAKEDRAGRFEIASGGTIFLDEIGNLSLPLQAKLLTVLQNRRVTRVGSNKEIPVDVRLICATNMPIYDMVAKNEFRQDLVYRVNTIELTLPPLRERDGDVPLLAQHFMQHYSKKYGRSLRSVHPVAIKKMEKYHWPGNVRELQHAIERAVIMTREQVLQPEDFFFTAGQGQNRPEESLRLEQFHLEEVEKMLIRKVLRKYDGNITEAAKELGLTRPSLYRRLEKYGI